MEKYKLDLQKFKSLPSCAYALADGRGGFCAQGKLYHSSGIMDVEGGLHSKDWPRDHENKRSEEKMMEIIRLNNSGYFAEADALALEWAMESGKFEFINAEPDPAGAPALEAVGV